MYKKLIYLVILTFVLSMAITANAENVGWWKFDDGAGTIAIDSSANGNNASLLGGPTWVDGMVAGAVDLDGTDDYVDLPIASVLSSLRNCTLAMWVNWSGSGAAWQRMFDFGSGESINMFLTPNTGANLLRFAITINTNGDEDQTTSPEILPTGWHHVAVVIDIDNTSHKLYLDGVVVDENTEARLVPSDMGVTTQNWLGRSQYSADAYFNGILDDFRIYDTALSAIEIHGIMAEDPRLAWEPTPTDGEVEVLLDQSLIWKPGIIAGTEADQYTEHQVYISTDFNEVDTATVPTATVVDANEYAAALDYDTTYYWRVDEVDTDGPVKGEVWSFKTANFIVLEDFESYSDDPPDEIWNTWIDGFGTTTNGSTAGYPDPDFIGGEHYVETTIVHGGNQSMPVFYDNRTAKLSEVTKTLTSLRNWTVDDVITLTLFYYGDAGNAIVPMYVAVNGNAISVNNTAKAVLTTDWTQWDIPMQDFAAQGVNLTNVSSISIGFGDKTSPVVGGVGHVFFDDIRLSRSEPVVVEPEIPSVNPGTANLVGYYAFENNVQDTSGRGNNATISGSPTYVQSATGYGTAIELNGTGDYLTFPIGTLLSTLTNSTFAAWVNWDGGTAWQRVFDFGSGEDINMFISPNAAGSILRFAMTITGNTDEDQTNGTGLLPSGWHHIAVTIDPTNTTHTLYLDGKVVGQNTAARYTPSSLGVTTQNWIGISQYPADPYYIGSIDEFRIYNKVLTRPEVLYLAGK